MTQAGQPGNPGDFFYGTPPHDGPVTPRAQHAEPVPAPVYAAQRPVTPPEFVATAPQVARSTAPQVAHSHATPHPGSAQHVPTQHISAQHVPAQQSTLAPQPAPHPTAQSAYQPGQQSGQQATPVFSSVQGAMGHGGSGHGTSGLGQTAAPGYDAVDPQIDTPEHPGRPPVSGAVNLLGAVTSIALVLGLGVWGYKLAVRDVSGVPVIQAQSGPMRIQPENPGGQLAVHSGLSVNAVQAEGTAEPTADRLVLAPNPVDVIAADEAGLDLATLDPSGRDTATVQSQAAAQEGQVAAIAAAVAEATAEATAETSADEAIVAEAGNGDTSNVAISAPEAIDLASVSLPIDVEAAPALEILPASVPGTVKSLRPLTRPGGFQALVDAQLAAKAEAQAAADKAAQDAKTAAQDAATQIASATPETVADTAVDPISAALSEANALPEIPAGDVVVGTNLAHLGPFDSPELARKEWVKLSGRFEGALEGKSLVVQEAQSGGREFYRLLAMGFDDISAARNFCSTLVAENAACIPMVLR